jgi:hypothetical protein
MPDTYRPFFIAAVAGQSPKQPGVACIFEVSNEDLQHTRNALCIWDWTTGTWSEITTRPSAFIQLTDEQLSATSAAEQQSLFEEIVIKNK